MHCGVRFGLPLQLFGSFLEARRRGMIPTFCVGAAVDAAKYVSVRLLSSSSERWLCELSSSTLLEVCRAYGIDGWPFVVGILEVIRCEAASDNCRRSEPSGFISFALWCQIWLTTTAVWFVPGSSPPWYDTYFLCWCCRRCS